MRPVDSRRGLSPRLRLQVVLLLLIVWDVLGIAAELTYGGPLFKFSGSKIDGLLGARGAFNGGLFVPLAVYVYAFVRGPGRRGGLLWVGVVEQLAGALFSVYHVASGDIRFGAAIAQLAVSLCLLVGVLLNMPREPAAS
jgi:hypothetical protein